MNQINRELNKILIPKEVVDAMYRGIQQAKREEVETREKHRVISKRKKLIGALAGLVAVGGLLFGSTFVSPAMAEMVSKIPYLNDVFLKDLDKDGAKSVMALVREEGLRRGYEVKGLRVGQGLMEGDEPDKVYVLLVSKDYNDKTKMDAEKLTKEMLDQKGYYAKSIQVLPFKADFYASQRRFNRIMSAQAKEIQKTIKDKGFNIDFIGMNPKIEKVFVILPESEKHVGEVHNIIQNYLTKHDYEANYPIDIRSVDLSNVDQDTKLEKNLYTIYEELLAKKEEYQVNNFIYTIKNQLVITIETSLEKKDQEIEEKIRKEVSSQLDKEYKEPYTINMVGLEELEAIGE